MNNKSKIKVGSNKLESKHLGNARALTSNGDVFRGCIKPSYEELATFSYLGDKEPIVKTGLQFLTLAIQKKFGEYKHENSDIQAFIRKATKKSIIHWVEASVLSALETGWSLGEIVYEPKKMKIEGKVDYYHTIKDIYFYPSVNTFFILNDHGILTHGEKVYTEIYETGAWVPAPDFIKEKMDIGNGYTGTHIRLNERKVFHLTLGLKPITTNPYGSSHLSPIVKFPFLKTVIDNQFITALDRYGNPLTAVIVPEAETEETIVESDGEERPLSYFESVANNLQDMNQNCEPFFVLEKPNGVDNDIKIIPITTGNNYADAFINGLDYYESQILRGMAIPNLLFKDQNSRLGSGGASEKQMEAFIMIIDAMYRKVVTAFLSGPISNLIKYNYDDPELIDGDVGEFNELPLRVADLETIAKSVKILKDSEIFDSKDEVQVKHYREMFAIPYTKLNNTKEQENIKRPINAPQEDL
jgi:hypothetical protein